MARSGRGRTVDWYSPDPRAVLPLDGFHVRRSLAKALRRRPFELRWGTAFDAVVAACAEPRGDGSGTWINPAIADVFSELHRQSLTHSVEAWADDELVGGLYGLSLGGAFFAESMFSRRPYASQACLVALVERMRAAGHTLLDVQFTNPHLEQFGVVELPPQRVPCAGCARRCDTSRPTLSRSRGATPRPAATSPRPRGTSPHSSHSPVGGSVGPARRRSRLASTSSTTPGPNRPRPTSTSVPAMIRTM